MNPSIVRNVHLFGLAALAVLTLVTLGQQFTTQYPSEYRAYQFFWMTDTLIVAALLGVRLWQVSSKNVAIEAKTPLESSAVSAGLILIVLGSVGALPAFVLGMSSMPGGSLNFSMAISAAWIGLALVELVGANGRIAAVEPAGSSRTFSAFAVGAIMLLVGIAVGVGGIFVIFMYGMSH